MYYDQAGFELRSEWGLAGLRAIGGDVDAVAIVDVLSFSTAVDIAVGRGASVFPYRWKDESARAFAGEKGAMLAGGRGSQYSLSPASLLAIPEGSALVLPSPNGSALALEAGGVATFAACLRNACAVARQAAARGRRMAVVAAGERWEDGSIRPCVEDMIGAGAVLDALPGTRSPEAEMAVAAFRAFRGDLAAALAGCSSGRELIERGFRRDVELAAEYGVSEAAPVLVGGRFVDGRTGAD